MFTEFEINVKDGLYHGLFTEKYNNGQLRSQLNYAHGVMHGAQQGWHYNGQLSYSYKAKKGTPVGEYKEYFPSGQLQINKRYEAGKVVKNKIYNIDGRVIANYLIKDGRTYGLMGSSTCITVLNEKEELTNEN